MGDKVHLELRGEIVSATDFDGDSLFLSYCFLLPNGWVCRDDKQLSGVTHCSKKAAKKVGTSTFGIAHFNQLFELSLTAPVNTGGCPRLVMEVSSVDFWERFRTEGYGLASLPLSPGRAELSVPTWRPLPSVATSQEARVADMRRFFIGGNPQLRDMGCALADTQEQTVVSRAGLRSATSGEVQIILDCSLQSSSLPGLSFSGQRTNNSSQHLVSSVDQVVEAFARVQARMAKVRESVRASLELADKK